MTKYFNTSTIYHPPAEINREQGFIKGVVLCQTGIAKGHNLYIDSDFLNQLATKGNEQSKGLKARFGHPNIFSTALGTYLGRYKNFRVEENKTIADLYFDKSAKSSPNGNLYDYVFDLADNNPDMFGVSIAFEPGKSLGKHELNSKEGKTNYFDIPSIEILYAADLVDDPAATNGLFEAYPQLLELLENKPQILEEILDKYKSINDDNTMNFQTEIQKLKDWVTNNFKSNPNPDLTSFDALKDDFTAQITALENLYKAENSQQVQTLTTENEGLKKVNTELQNAYNLLESQHNQLQAKSTFSPPSTDPALSIHKADKDNSGKLLLQAIPPEFRKKLKQVKSNS